MTDIKGVGDCPDVPDGFIVDIDIIECVHQNGRNMAENGFVIFGFPRLKGFINKLKELYPDCCLYAVSPPYTADCDDPASEIPDRLRDVSAEIGRNCVEYGIRYLNGYLFIPHEQRFFTDKAHPNDLGFSAYALSLIRELLRDRKREGE